MNSTYFDALGQREDEYLIARALQFFAPGTPQIYYVGLLGGTNDMALLNETNVGRDINRHYYCADEVQSALATPMVRRLIDLIRLRNEHPAFDGAFSFEQIGANQLKLVWQKDDATAQLDVDFKATSARMTCSGGAGGHFRFV